MRIRHAKVSGVANPGDPSLVGGEDWDSDHVWVDPVLDLFGDPDTAFEFDTSSLTGLTTFGSPDTINADSSAPGCLYLKDTGTSWQFCGVYAAATPPFTAIALLADHWVHQQYNYAGMFVGEATPGRMAHIDLRYDNGGGARGPGGYHGSSPTDSTGLGSTWAEPTIQHISGQIWFAVTVDGSNNCDLYASLNGRVWRKVKSALAMGATVGSAGLAINVGSTGASRVTVAAFDFLRIWNSVLTLPGL